ncbi:metallophosphoesterase family protein [Brevibacterium salitolerans]|uniref:Calcineurin-like phosphoesterase domain-containing protein n=1 Tax=Brevibacterium salitolerans TaxID=1403566 RepID=A0ABP5IGT8_9MICO
MQTSDHTRTAANTTTRPAADAAGTAAGRGPWMPRLRRALRMLAALVLCCLVAAPVAVLTARAQSTFGPHEAVYSVTTDGALEADFGPLGSLVLPAGDVLPGRLGVHIEVGEIPAEYGMEDATVDALGGDAAAYAALFADPGAQGRVVAAALLRDAALRTAVMGGALFAVGAAVRLLLGGSRRRGLLTAIPADGSALSRLPSGVVEASPRLRLGAAATVAAVVLGGAVLPIDRDREIRPDPVFEDTPLAGAQVTGRLSGIIDEAAKAVADMLGDTDAFYSEVRAGLAAAWPQRPLSPRWRSGEDGVPGPAAAAGPAEGGAGGEDAPAAPPAAPEDTDVATLVWTSDIHCQTGMSRTIGDVIAWSGADLHIDGGDVTMTGTEAENVCVDSVARSVPDGVPTVFVKGNHDSEDTVARAKEVGWTVLEGEPVEVAGLTLLGDSDPRRTVFPSGDVLERGETGEEFAARMAEAACAADEDLFVIHDPRQAEDALGRGCADHALSGHWHRRVEPEQLGRGVRTVGSTTGGALADALTPGPLKMPAEMSLIRVDRSTGAPIDVQYITVGMDAAVEFSEWIPFPSPRPLVETEPEDADGSED